MQEREPTGRYTYKRDEDSELKLVCETQKGLKRNGDAKMERDDMYNCRDCRNGRKFRKE